MYYPTAYIKTTCPSEIVLFSSELVFITTFFGRPGNTQYIHDTWEAFSNRLLQNMISRFYIKDKNI